MTPECPHCLKIIDNSEEKAISLLLNIKDKKLNVVDGVEMCPYCRGKIKIMSWKDLLKR